MQVSEMNRLKASTMKCALVTGAQLTHRRDGGPVGQQAKAVPKEQTRGEPYQPFEEVL